MVEVQLVHWDDARVVQLSRDLRPRDEACQVVRGTRRGRSSVASAYPLHGERPLEVLVRDSYHDTHPASAYLSEHAVASDGGAAGEASEAEGFGSRVTFGSTPSPWTPRESLQDGGAGNLVRARHWSRRTAPQSSCRAFRRRSRSSRCSAQKASKSASGVSSRRARQSARRSSAALSRALESAFVLDRHPA